MKILVIEDEVKLAEYLRKGLSEEGYTVDVAHTGIDGRHLALTSDYDERTSLTRWRFVFGWAGGLVMLTLAFGLAGAAAPAGWLWLSVAYLRRGREGLRRAGVENSGTSCTLWRMSISSPRVIWMPACSMWLAACGCI